MDDVMVEEGLPLPEVAGFCARLHVGAVVHEVYDPELLIAMALTVGVYVDLPEEIRAGLAG